MKLSKRSSWHNMGLDEDSWPGSQESEEEKEREKILIEFRKQNDPILKQKHEEFEKKLDDQKHLSLAHQALAKDSFSFPNDATPICSDGDTQIFAKSFPDDSILIYMVGEMGVDEIKPFLSIEKAKLFFDSLNPNDFYPL